MVGFKDSTTTITDTMTPAQNIDDDEDPVSVDKSFGSGSSVGNDDSCGVDNGFSNDNRSREIDPALESAVDLVTPGMAANFSMPNTWKRVPATSNQ